MFDFFLFFFFKDYTISRVLQVDIPRKFSDFLMPRYFYDQPESLTSMKVFLVVSDEALLREYASEPSLI